MFAEKQSTKYLIVSKDSVSQNEDIFFRYG